jgi:hypothetical protein
MRRPVHPICRTRKSMNSRAFTMSVGGILRVHRELRGLLVREARNAPLFNSFSAMNTGASATPQPLGAASRRTSPLFATGRAVNAGSGTLKGPIENWRLITSQARRCELPC